MLDWIPTVAAALLLGAAPAQPQPTPAASAAALTEEEAVRIATDAYIYAYPLVLMDVTRRQMTNHAEPRPIGVGPANRFNHAQAFAAEGFTEVVRPNVDTLYSSAWIDLGDEPVVLTVPQTDRYMLLPLLCMWTDVFAVPGTRTTGTAREREFVIVGPSFDAAGAGGTRGLPADLSVIRSPTRWVWIIGRTQTNGPEDYENVHRIQAAMDVRPLSARGVQGYAPPAGKVDPAIDMRTPPPEQVARMPAAEFFARYSELVRDNPPVFYDYPMLHRMERLGLKVGEAFDASRVAAPVLSALERGAEEGRARIKREAERRFHSSAGWAMPDRGGAYGTDYVLRAVIGAEGLGMNLLEDAVYPSTSNDGEGRPLSGDHRYVIRFEADELPPVDAFWSVTAYDEHGYLIPNAIKRYAVGDRSGLAREADGSLVIHIQAESPGAQRESNWLPVAAGQPFNLLLRLYSPREEVAQGRWRPPAPQRLD